MQLHGVVYNYCGRVADWTATLTLTPTPNLTLTLKKEKVEYFDWNLRLNCTLKWIMTCEASVGISAKTVTVFSQTLFSCAGDRLAQKMPSFLEPQYHVEAYNVMWSVLTCSGIFYDHYCLYKIFCSTLQGDINQIP